MGCLADPAARAGPRDESQMSDTPTSIATDRPARPLPLRGPGRGQGSRRSGWWRTSSTAGLLTLAFVAGRHTAPSERPAAPPVQNQAELDPREAADQVSRALQQASEDAARSVVQVRSRGRGRRGSQEGSGVVVRADGLVVTNHHVVENGATFEVVFTDGAKRRADLLGSDESIDLAVLRIRGEQDYPPMELRTELPPVGELVLAVGNPLSLGHTVTLGVVNGLGREGLDIADYENYIQTDAAINPGNSGGPLVDVHGRAVGITVAVGLESNGDGGLAFAIPAAMVEHVVDDILEHGRVRRAYLGVLTHWANRYYDPTSSERASGYDGTSQVKVRRVYDNTPADRAGLRDGDIILAIGKSPMSHRASFRNALIESDPGDRVEIRVWRSGKELVKIVALEDRDRPSR